MQIQLKPLELSDTEVLYDFFQEMPASENGKKNGAHGLPKEDFAKWVQKELDFANNRNLPEGYVPGTTFVMYVDGTPVGISNLRHYLNKKLEQDGGHIGTHILPKYRGQGYGTIIKQKTLEKAKEMGIKTVLIFNHDTNTPAWRSSEKLGGKLDSINEVNGVKIRKYIFDTSKIF